MPSLLTTKERVKQRLDLNDTASRDELLDALIYSVSSFIESHCSRTFKEQTYTEELYDGMQIDRTPKTMLILDNAPIKTLTKYEYRSGSRTNPTWFEFQDDSYEILKDRGILMNDGELPKDFRNIRVTYDAGYKIDFDNFDDSSKHELPFDLSDLAERLVVRRFKQREMGGFSSTQQQGSSIELKSNLDPMDKEILANYMRSVLTV